MIKRCWTVFTMLSRVHMSRHSKTRSYTRITNLGVVLLLKNRDFCNPSAGDARLASQYRCSGRCPLLDFCQTPTLVTRGLGQAMSAPTTIASDTPTERSVGATCSYNPPTTISGGPSAASPDLHSNYWVI